MIFKCVEWWCLGVGLENFLVCIYFGFFCGNWWFFVWVWYRCCVWGDVIFVVWVWVGFCLGRDGCECYYFVCCYICIGWGIVEW